MKKLLKWRRLANDKRGRKVWAAKRYRVIQWLKNPLHGNRYELIETFPNSRPFFITTKPSLAKVKRRAERMEQHLRKLRLAPD